MTARDFPRGNVSAATACDTRSSLQSADARETVQHEADHRRPAAVAANVAGWAVIGLMATAVTLMTLFGAIAGLPIGGC